MCCSERGGGGETETERQRQTDRQTDRRETKIRLVIQNHMPTKRSESARERRIKVNINAIISNTSALPWNVHNAGTYCDRVLLAFCTNSCCSAVLRQQLCQCNWRRGQRSLCAQRTHLPKDTAGEIRMLVNKYTLNKMSQEYSFHANKNNVVQNSICQTPTSHVRPKHPIQDNSLDRGI